MTRTMGKEKGVARGRRFRYQIDYSGYVYVAPALIFILFCSVIPIFMSIYYSFHSFNLIHAPTFVGLRNFTRMLDDPFMTVSIRNTLLLVLIVVPVQSLLALLFAVIITSLKKNMWTGFVKSAMFVPVVASMALVGNIWRIIMGLNQGLLNQLLGVFNIAPINWLGDRNMALLAVCVMIIWKNIGYFMVIYIAAILDISAEYYEAAKVDGAGRFLQFLYITLPSIKPVNYLVVLLGSIWSFQTFDAVYVMTNGGPGDATTTMVLNIYNVAFRMFNFGYGSALAMVLFVIVMIISGAQRFAFADRGGNKV